MKILNRNYKEIVNIVQSKAKYQKIMLLYDDSVTNEDITKLYDSVKDYCIFNKLNIQVQNIEEIYNGYRVLIFLCSADSFVGLKINREEIINIYCPSDEEILPFFLNDENVLSKQNDYMLLPKGIDVNILSSLYFNRFYNHIKDLIYFQSSDAQFDFNPTEITQHSVIETLNKVNADFEFKDIDIIKHAKIPYSLLPLVDYLLITAFDLIIDAVKSQTLMLVDVYKAVKDDYKLVDKFYAYYNNNCLINLINLNYQCLKRICEKSKEKIVEFLFLNCNVKEEVDSTIEKIKTYSKYAEDIMCYLYLYNVFDK